MEHKINGTSSRRRSYILSIFSIPVALGAILKIFTENYGNIIDPVILVGIIGMILVVLIKTLNGDYRNGNNDK